MIVESEKRNIYRITIVLYAVLNFVLLVHHEAWRDEAQAWTIARNLNIGEIINLLSTEGHLLPYFVILKVWYRLGGAYAWIGLISLSLMTVAAALFLYKSPFAAWTKLIILVSPIFFYYNAVIARCYALVMLALVLTAVTRKKMREHMLAYALSVAFLMQTHILVIPLAVSLCAELLVYSFMGSISKKQVAMTSIPMVSLVLAFLELYQKKKTAFITYDTIQSNFTAGGIEPIRDRLKTIITEVYAEGRIYHIVMILLVIGIVMLICFAAIMMTEKNHSIKPEILVCGLGLFGYLAIVGFVRECAHIQMALVFYMLIMFAAWVSTDAQQTEISQKKEPYSGLYAKQNSGIRTILTVVLVLLTMLSFRKEFLEIKYDYYNNYSNSKMFASEATAYLPRESVVLIRQEDYRISAPYAYLMDEREDVKFWDVDEEREYTCIIWGKEYPEADLDRYATDFKSNVYYLTSKRIEEMGQPVITAEEPNPWEENYYLYDVTNGNKQPQYP